MSKSKNLPPIICIMGRKGSGKTKLIERLIKDLTPLGYKIAVLKHIHHEEFDVDVEGKDTWRYNKAGAQIVVGISRLKTFIVKKTLKYPDVREIINSISGDVDLIIMEGFRHVAGRWDDAYKIIIPKTIEELPELLKGLREPILGIYSESKLYGNLGERFLNYDDLKRVITNDILKC